MKSIANIYIILSFFVYIISCSIIYMIVKDMLNMRFNKKVDKLENTFGKEVLRQLNNVKSNKELSKIDIKYIKENLNKRPYVKVFNNHIFKFNENEKNHKFTKIYMLNFEDVILGHIKKCKRKDDTIKSYCAVLLGEYKLNNFEVNNFLFNCINTKSIYLRVSSLKAISKIGNLNNFIEALVYISDEDKYINNKILIDILGQFGGNKSLLNRQLINKFSLFNENIKKTIVEHFKNDKIVLVKDNMLDILKNESSDKEVRISVIKYFSIVKCESAKNEVIEILKKYDWEYRAICASALGNYKDEESIDALLISIGDKNWHVRYNSAISLLRFEEDYIIDRVLKKNDKYSRDILFYAMFMKNKIPYEECLEMSRKIEEDTDVKVSY
ncbi:HEAT repeat domain-containing protein [[Clostridium] dakarense]|uniref:HEAT repeat domain-containing protein n=1 Tax=Faecalimicrobium dakarense TaxID=1301100 RepID=UPI0006939631|nr:HEAT repeat domain-containing protein [[Clostridium] dakarense]